MRAFDLEIRVKDPDRVIWELLRRWSYREEETVDEEALFRAFHKDTAKKAEHCCPEALLGSCNLLWNAKIPLTPPFSSLPSKLTFGMTRAQNHP